MNQSVNDRIRERAYFLWKQDEGHRRSDEEYWLQAERKILGEELSTPQEAAEKLEAQKANVEAEEKKKKNPPSKAAAAPEKRKSKSRSFEAETKPTKAGPQKEEPKKGPRKPASKTSPRNAGSRNAGSATATLEGKAKS